jgi:hypothetical protein
VDQRQEPQQLAIYREVTQPDLLPTLRDGGEALIRLAAFLEKLVQEEEPAQAA